MPEGCNPEPSSALGEQHKKFESFVGTFKANVKMWMGSGVIF